MTFQPLKIALLSDIHGNFPALQTVATHIEKWQPDHIIVNGDTVNRGPSSTECWLFVRDKAQFAGWHLLRGNHERFVMEHAKGGLPSAIITSASGWTARKMGETLVAELAILADGMSLFAPDGSELRVRHASMRGDRDCVWPDSSEAELLDQIAPQPACFGSGHIHRPYLRHIPGTLIVNAGSVGTPIDGDLRSSYAQITWQAGVWSAEIIRLAYDREQTTRDYDESGLLTDAGPMAKVLFHEWRLGRGMVSTFVKKYLPLVVEGKVSAEAAIQKLLQNQ